LQTAAGVLREDLAVLMIRLPDGLVSVSLRRQASWRRRCAVVRRKVPFPPNPDRFDNKKKQAAAVEGCDILV
jgi:hypothetical protein